MFKYKAEIWFYLCCFGFPFLLRILDSGYAEASTSTGVISGDLFVVAAVCPIFVKDFFVRKELLRIGKEVIREAEANWAYMQEKLERYRGIVDRLIRVMSENSNLLPRSLEIAEALSKELEDKEVFIEKERNSSKFNVFKAALAKTSGNLEAWKDASGDMARLAFECGKEGPKKRTRNDLNNLCKRLNIELTPGQLEEVRKALPAEYVDKQNRAEISP